MIENGNPIQGYRTGVNLALEEESVMFSGQNVTRLHHPPLFFFFFAAVENSLEVGKKEIKRVSFCRAFNVKLKNLTFILYLSSLVIQWREA